MAEKDDITMPELVAELADPGHDRCTFLDLALADPPRLSLQKTLLASEQDRSDIARGREAWIKKHGAIQLNARLVG